MKTINEWMAKDHDRLDALFQKFISAKKEDLPTAKQVFVEFKRGLERHIMWEEEILFPIFEGRTGMHASGPTQIMRLEHEQIKGFLEEINDKLAKEITVADSLQRDLFDLLKMHNDKEEGILYPWIDQVASKKELEEIINYIRPAIE